MNYHDFLKTDIELLLLFNVCLFFPNNEAFKPPFLQKNYSIAYIFIIDCITDNNNNFITNDLEVICLYPITIIYISALALQFLSIFLKSNNNQLLVILKLIFINSPQN